MKIVYEAMLLIKHDGLMFGWSHRTLGYYKFNSARLNAVYLSVDHYLRQEIRKADDEANS